MSLNVYKNNIIKHYKQYFFSNEKKNDYYCVLLQKSLNFNNLLQILKHNQKILLNRIIETKFGYMITHFCFESYI